RHIKDGLAGNSFSKSILRVSIENLIKEFSEEYPDSFDYFPAYEIVNDDLRDYRFYQSDLLHPNDQAVDYIWEKFTETYLNVEQSKLLAEGENILKGLNHRPLIERHEIERERMQSLRNKYKELQKKWHEVSNIEFSAYGI
ncbi:MAG: GSCFA domain-containing protein, partial [Muribaculaceae bacterium]|nr:GSCFA domain-containing protein [Muribaculaceae bacterium]